VYDIFVPGNQPKTSSFWLPCQHPSSSADFARELFKPSKDSASLLDGSISLKFFWKLGYKPSLLMLWMRLTRLESESFEPLIDF